MPFRRRCLRVKPDITQHNGCFVNEDRLASVAPKSRLIFRNENLRGVMGKVDS